MPVDADVVTAVDTSIHFSLTLKLPPGLVVVEVGEDSDAHARASPGS